MDDEFDVDFSEFINWDQFTDDVDDETYDDRKSTRKRRKLTTTKKSSFHPLTEFVSHASNLQVSEELSFEDTFDALLPDFVATRDRILDQDGEIVTGEHLRPLSRYEVSAIIHHIQKTLPPHLALPTQSIALRKLKLIRQRRIAGYHEPCKEAITSAALVPLPPSKPETQINPAILNALYAIRTTKYERSFLSRLCGHRTAKRPGLIAVDWETQTPWMHLMSDIRDHYSLAHSEREQPEEYTAPITYHSMQLSHLDQVHDLLRRSFWEGIDVSDALHSPERCTVIAAYKHLVVGAALLSSPQETYITYLTVRAGWDNSQIATAMLHHLISLNPNRDVTLHVSASNPAMLLYNRFGFKAEEFVAGFYDDYLDPQSRMSKNAFRLRLRRN